MQDWINNFWRACWLTIPPLCNGPGPASRKSCEPGALDALTKEMIYLAVSASNQCPYCIASHTAAARKAGMTDAMSLN